MATGLSLLSYYLSFPVSVFIPVSFFEVFPGIIILLLLIYRYPSKTGKETVGTASHKHLHVAGLNFSPRAKNMLVIISDLRTIAV